MRDVPRRQTTPEQKMKELCVATISSSLEPTNPRNRRRRRRTPQSKRQEQLIKESTDADLWETGSIAHETKPLISDLSPGEAPQIPINEGNVVMVDLDLSRGVISSINPENGSYSGREVEETEIKELEPSLEPLSAAKLDLDTEEPIIAIPPSPKLTSISEELEPLSPHEEDEVQNSLNEETEVEALLNDYSKEEKEKGPEEKSTDLMDDESRTPDPEIRQKLKESLPEEIRRLIYPADYLEAEVMEPAPNKGTSVPMNTAKAILKRKKLGAKQRKRLRKSMEKSNEELINNESGCQIWWKNEAIMQQILENPKLYPPPNGFPSDPASNEETEPEPTLWDMEEDDDKSFTIGRYLHLGMF